ncbi:methyltransferase family protein [Kribbella amoyensis]|uniref:Methyltransferase family protein n=1 Tax=Kribbella amoyensis TaxID=996641 RepID=A0A561B397_9ACTN|nr:class I SAM-dependent methyltransferase [Kribbella amoyensis]TWD73333.1 methyltransferase family protein [Kribbella amoyensis]
MADALFEDRRLVELYDPLETDRSDLDVYAAIVAEFAARSVLDVGCGTGTFACLLASRGIAVTGVDPAGASLEVAKGKEFADRVHWIHGDATSLPELAADLATMTGNVAQVFLTDEEWGETLVGIRDALVPGGRLVFETRDPAQRAWEEWTRDQTHAITEVPGIGQVESWGELISVELPFVSFRGSYVFASDGAVLTSESTLRFRSRAEVEESLRTAGYEVDEVRGAPDRPGREFVFVARKR